MKLIIAICLLGSFSLAFSSEEELPSEVQQLVLRRNDAVLKIDRTFVEELEKLKVKYTKAADLEKANMVVRLIEKTKGSEAEEKFSLDGKWLYNEKIIRTFSGNVMTDYNGQQHFWSYQKGIITIHFGNNWEKFKFDSKNPDTLKGADNGGNSHVYKRISK